MIQAGSGGGLCRMLGQTGVLPRSFTRLLDSCVVGSPVALLPRLTLVREGRGIFYVPLSSFFESCYDLASALSQILGRRVGARAQRAMAN